MPRLSSKSVPKLWGSETWIVNNSKYCGKILTLTHGYQCSLHYHPIKEETFYVLRGKVILEVREDGRTSEIVVLHPGECYHLLPNTPHRFRAMEYDGAEILEVSTPHDDGDVVRIEDSRKIEE